MAGQSSRALSEHHPAAECNESPGNPGEALKGPAGLVRAPLIATESPATPQRPGDSLAGPARSLREAVPAVAEHPESPLRPEGARDLPSRACLAAEHLESSLRPGDALGLPQRAPTASAGSESPFRPPAAEYSESPLRPRDALEGPAQAALEEVQRQKEGRQKAAAALWKQMQDLSLQTNAMLLGAMNPSPPRPHPKCQLLPSEGLPALPNDACKAVAGSSVSSSMLLHAGRPIPVADVEQQIPGVQCINSPADCSDAAPDIRQQARSSRTPHIGDQSHSSHAAAGSLLCPLTTEGSDSSSMPQAGGLSGAAHAGALPRFTERPAPWPLPESTLAVARQEPSAPQPPAAEQSGVLGGAISGLRASQLGRSVSLGERKGSVDGSQGNGPPRGKENRALSSNVGGKAPPANAAKGAARSCTRWVPSGVHSSHTE